MVRKPVVVEEAEVEIADKEKAKRLNPIKLRQMQERHASLEEEIPRIEGAIARLSTLWASSSAWKRRRN